MAVNGCDSPSEQHYSLKWNDYSVKLVTAFQSLREEEDFVDVTVACEGRQYSAHRMVLSACSPYFRTMLKANPCKHPIVILKDVGCAELERLLEFMYNGEVNIAQDQLGAFLRTAESLKIRGLAGGGAPAAFEEQASKMRFGAATSDTHQQQQHCDGGAEQEPHTSLPSHPLPKKRKLMLAEGQSSRGPEGGGAVHSDTDSLVTGNNSGLLPLKSEPADGEPLSDVSVPFVAAAGGDGAEDPASGAGLYSVGSEHNGGDPHVDGPPPAAPPTASDAVAGCEALNLSVRPHQRSPPAPPAHHLHLHHHPSAYTATHHSERGVSRHHEYPHHHHHHHNHHHHHSQHQHHHQQQQRHHSAPGVVRCISIPEQTELHEPQHPHELSTDLCPQYRSHSIGPRLADAHDDAATRSAVSPPRNGHPRGAPPAPPDGLLYHVKLEYPQPKQERLDMDEEGMDLGGGGDSVVGDLALHGDLHLTEEGGGVGHEYGNSAALSAISTILSAEQMGSRASDDCSSLKASILHRSASLPNGDVEDECEATGRRNTTARPPNPCGLGAGHRAHSSSGASNEGSSGKVYPCSECAKVFRHPMSLHHHRHVHRGTYTCHSCTKVFSRRWDLHRHLHRSKLGCRRPSNGTSATASAVSASSSTAYSSATSGGQNCLVLSPDSATSRTSNASSNLQCSPPYATKSGGAYKLVSASSHRPKITIACDLISPPSTRDHVVSLTNGGELYTSRSSSHNGTSSCKSLQAPLSCDASSEAAHASQASPPQGGPGCQVPSFPPSRL